MTAQGTKGTIEGLTVLIFSYGKVRIAVDTEQIDGILDLPQAREMKVALLDIHGEHFNGEGRPDDFRVLLLKGRSFFGLVAEVLREIVFLHIESIRPMPAMIQSAGKIKALWGGFMKDGEMIFLADLKDYEKFYTIGGR